LLSGETFAGFEGLREVILARQDRFVRNFVSQMMRYAFGRGLLYTDGRLYGRRQWKGLVLSSEGGIAWKERATLARHVESIARVRLTCTI